VAEGRELREEGRERGGEAGVGAPRCNLLHFETQF